MALARFNPFGKERSRLVASDLSTLRDVAEGWYVDYKRDPPDAPRIAKHISSFANTYGGWLFIGVVGGGPSNTATAFPGVASGDVPQLLEKISQSCSGHLSPPPHFETSVVSGPEPSINLDEGRSIIVVEIPSGGSPPYVHSSGRIYRRVGEQSEPRAETDRALLDLLWKRRESAEGRLSRFFSDIPTVSEAERDNSFVHLFVLPDPLGDRDYRSSMTFAKFAEVLRRRPSADNTLFGLPFNNLCSTSTGFAARQTRNNDPASGTLALRYEDNGNFRAHIPLPWTTVRNKASLAGSRWRRYQHRDAFIDALDAEGYKSPRAVDLTDLFLVLGGLFSLRRMLLTADDLPIGGFAKVRLDNVWRRVPYLDTTFFADHIREFGVPCVRESNMEIPGPEPFDLLQIEKEAKPDGAPKEPWLVDLVNAALVTIHLATAFGIPSPGEGERRGHYIMELIRVFVGTGGQTAETLPQQEPPLVSDGPAQVKA